MNAAEAQATRVHIRIETPVASGNNPTIMRDDRAVSISPSGVTSISELVRAWDTHNCVGEPRILTLEVLRFTVTHVEGTTAWSATEYVILAADPEGHWEDVGGNETAGSSGAALRQAIAKMEEGLDPSGTYIAVPTRSFRPVTVTVERQTRVKFEGGDN